MFIVDLECENEHRFEGWYDTAAEFHDLKASNDVTCPLCSSASVTQRLQTGSIHTTKTAERQRTASVPLDVQQAMAKVVKWVRQTHEDVGDAFADSARAIHRGDAPSRPIRGRSTPEEESALKAEGVPFVKVPIPDIEQN